MAFTLEKRFFFCSIKINNMSFTGNENQEISLQDAADLTANYRQNQPYPYPELGGYFAKSGLLDVLNQNGCVGIRIYYGQDNSGESKLVIVGVDANENDLYQGLLLDHMYKCPTNCSSSNQLNS